MSSDIKKHLGAINSSGPLKTWILATERLQCFKRNPGLLHNCVLETEIKLNGYLTYGKAARRCIPTLSSVVRYGCGSSDHRITRKLSGRKYPEAIYRTFMRFFLHLHRSLSNFDIEWIKTGTEWTLGRHAGHVTIVSYISYFLCAKKV